MGKFEAVEAGCTSRHRTERGVNGGTLTGVRNLGVIFTRGTFEDIM